MRTTSLCCSQQAAVAELVGFASSDSRAGHPRLLLRCSAVQDGLWVGTERLLRLGLNRFKFEGGSLAFVLSQLPSGMNPLPPAVRPLPSELKAFGWELSGFKSEGGSLTFVLSQLPSEMSQLPPAVRPLPSELKEFGWALSGFKSEGGSLTFVLDPLPSEMSQLPPAVRPLPSALKELGWELSGFKSKGGSLTFVLSPFPSEMNPFPSARQFAALFCRGPPAIAALGGTVRRAPAFPFPLCRAEWRVGRADKGCACLSP